jgi:glycosyltransferase involved in cell wall biosynthesis
LNLIYVNFVHPETPHVSSMRLRLFADALTRLGHQVMTVTHPKVHNSGETLPSIPPRLIADSLLKHDWRSPFHFSCPAKADWRDLGGRDQDLPRPIRRALIVSNLLLRGGLNDDWVRGSRPYWPIIASAFRPDLVCGVYGDPSSLTHAQGLAREARVPWLMDIKDNWERTLAPVVRQRVADRFADAIGFTANARFHAGIASKYHRQVHAVVYSGVTPEMIASAKPPNVSAAFRIVLIGSLYDERRLQRFLSCLSGWLRSLNVDNSAFVEFHYAGSQPEMLEATLAAAPLSCKIQIHSQLPIEKLGELCQSATVNTYLWSPVTFHHKLLELLACRRPVISFPGEHEESIKLAREFGGDLTPCFSEHELAAALCRTWRNWRDGSTGNAGRVDVASLTWDAMARKLESFLTERHEAAMLRTRGARRSTI